MKKITIVLTMALASCAHSVGVKIEQVTYDSFVEGQTTQAYVRKTIGSPQNVSYNGNNLVESYSYSRVGAKNFIPGYVHATGGQIDCLTTTFEYNPKQVLVRKYANDCSRK